MLRRPPRSTRTDTSFPTRRSSDLYAGLNPALDHLIYTLSDYGLLKGGLFMAFLWWHWFRRDDATETRRGQIIIALTAPAVAVIVSRILQAELPFRDRTMHNAALHFMLPDGVGSGQLDGWSRQAGHTAD